VLLAVAALLLIGSGVSYKPCCRRAPPQALTRCPVDALYNLALEPAAAVAGDTCGAHAFPQRHKALEDAAPRAIPRAVHERCALHAPDEQRGRGAARARCLGGRGQCGARDRRSRAAATHESGALGADLPCRRPAIAGTLERFEARANGCSWM